MDRTRPRDTGPGPIPLTHPHIFTRMQGLATIVTRNQVVAWVTDTRNFAAPVADVAVTVYGNLPSAVVVGRAVTDARGIATVAIAHAHSDRGLHVVAQRPGETAHAEAQRPSSRSPWPLTGDLVLGRRLHRPNETVHVKGFLARFAGDGAALPVSEACRSDGLRLELALGRGTEMKQSVDCGSRFGTFSAAFALPENVTVGRKSLMLRERYFKRFRRGRRGSWSFKTVAETFVLVSDPRVPTGVLELRSNERVLLRSVSALPLTVVTRAGTGERARGTRVALRWRIQRRTDAEADPQEDGDVEGYASAQGCAGRGPVCTW